MQGLNRPASHTEGTALKDLLMLAGKRKGKLIASCLLLILNAGLAVIPFLLVYQLLLGLFNPPFNLWKMWYLVAAIPVVYIIANALLICAYDLSHRAAFEILYEIRLRLGERMVQMPLGYYAGKNTGEFETVMNESVERLEFFLAHHFPEIITTIFVPIVLAVFLFVLDWRMAIASTTLPLLALGVIIFSGIRWPEMVEKYITAQSMVNSTIVEYIQGIAAIKAFNQTAESFRRFQKNMAFWRDSLFKWNEETALPFTVYQTLITASLSRGCR
jgi:ATP-binding cassette subfamily B protein IrtA